MSPLLVGAALGATSAFILDPQQGARRRTLVRDKVTRGLNDGRELADAMRKDRSRALIAGVGVASTLYALARGGIGALVPLALGAALLACAVNATPRARPRRA